jgi:hypothetical protein
LANIKSTGGRSGVQISSAKTSSSDDAYLYLDGFAGSLAIRAGENSTSLEADYGPFYIRGGQYDVFGNNAAQNIIISTNFSIDRVQIAGSDGAVSILSNVSSTSTTSGSLVVAGGVGIGGNLNVGGLTTLAETTKVLNTKSSSTGTVTHDFSTGDIWYHDFISGEFTANFTNVPTTDNRIIVCTLILSQGTTARIPAIQINGLAATINWLGGGSPTGNADKIDIVSFTLIRRPSAWTVLGSLTSYG